MDACEQQSEKARGRAVETHATPEHPTMPGRAICGVQALRQGAVSF